MNASARKPDAAKRPRPRRLAAWREQHAWCLSASMQRLAARPLGTLLTVAVMGFALALPLSFWLLLTNVEHLGAALGETQAVSVFMKTGVDAQQAGAAAAKLRGRLDVASVTVKTPKQGLAELSTMQGFTKALGSLHYNPLPYVLLVQPRAEASAAQTRTLVAALKAMPEADLVQDDGAWRQRLDALVDVGRRMVGVLALLLAVAALLVVGNSVRMDIQGRVEEIEVLKLVGASRAFVRRPYLYAGAWYGAAAGVLAVLLVLLLEWALAGPVERLADVYAGRMAFGGLGATTLLAVPMVAAALGWLGARLVSARQLRNMM